jgi:hypothetical protein
MTTTKGNKVTDNTPKPHKALYKDKWDWLKKHVNRNVKKHVTDNTVKPLKST